MINYPKHLFPILFILMNFSCQYRLVDGNYVEQIGELELHYSIKGKGPVMIVGHPNSGKIGYELSLKPLVNHFTMVYYDPRGTGNSEAPNTLVEYNQEF